MEIDKELYNDIKAYCDLNGIKTREYIHNLLKKAFMEDKYGKMPEVFVKKSVEEKGKNNIVKAEPVKIVVSVDTAESDKKEEPKIEKKAVIEEVKPKSKKIKL